MDQHKDLEKSLVVIPIPENVLFPGGVVQLRLNGGQSEGIIHFLENQSPYAACFAFKGERDSGDLDLEKVGTLAKVEWYYGDGEYWDLKLTGMERIERTQILVEPGKLLANYTRKPDINDLTPEATQKMMDEVKTLSLDILEMMEEGHGGVSEMVSEFTDLGTLINFCAQNIELSKDERQEFLELVSLRGRAMKCLEYLAVYREKILLQIEMNNRVADSTNKIHRENLLREQMRAIQDELGDGASNKAEDYRKRVMDSGMSQEVKDIALEEVDRLQAQGPHSPETNGIRNYLDTLLALPWHDPEESDIDLIRAREVLEKDHYGLEMIKKRIIQHLAVMKIKKNRKGALLLFVGPPGVGKTSLGRSIAKALGREFTKTSLGGVRDESEIKGHRRTYLGALPGRIIQNMKRLEKRNPVFVLDEIDKLSKGWSGDPGASLLEVLDPEQNHAFVDHYMDVPYDLSQVFFIATANTLESIPGPLLDRMEVIQLSSYTDVEKFQIAKRHLIPKQLEEHGLKSDQLEFPDEALKTLVSSYTRESGVRELQRKIATLCRVNAEPVLSSEPELLPLRVSLDQIKEEFRTSHVKHASAEEKNPPGVATGLAWTPVGGEILFMETSAVPGKGKLVLTGRLGDVMKESAQIAITLIKANLPSVAKNFDFEKSELHIHVPEGATPKDGPSAGIALLAALTSLVTGKSVPSDTALTGEVTLRGRVMPVGGIKEKFIAAHRAGIRRIFMSRQNEKDLRDIPEEIRRDLEIISLDRVDEVFAKLFGVNLPLQKAFGWVSAAQPGL